MIEVTPQLGEILLNHGVISHDQLEAALDYQMRRGCRLGEALISLHMCTETDIGRAVAEQNGIRFFDLKETPPTGEAIRLVPREVAVEHGLVPVRVEGNRLVVVARDPFDLGIDEIIRRAAGMRVLVAGGTDSQIREVLSDYERFKWSDGTPDRARGSAPAAAEPLAAAPRPAPSPMRPQPLTNHHLDSLLAEVVHKGATDLYMEPVRDGFRVRCRIDGFTHTMPAMPRYRMEGILKRLKIMTGVDFQQPAVSTTARCRLKIDDQVRDLRATVLAEAEGVFAAFRLQDPDEPVRPLDTLGLDPEPLRELRRRLLGGQGLVLVAGPGGSGRPTTLYALLKHLQESGLQVLALEGTVERKISGFGQVQLPGGDVQPFATALEMCLSQRTDVLMVGELPDRESAELACRAASTGQMVLAGSLSSNALRAVTRLLDMGVNPHDAAAALTAVVGQRLLRRVCESCAQDYQMPYPLERAVRETFGWPRRARFKTGRGCPECHELGTRGCIGVFEVLLVNDDFRSLLAERVPPSVLQERLERQGFQSLEADAFRKVCRGVIAPEELPRLGLRVAAAMDAAAVEAAAPSHPDLLDEDEELPDAAEPAPPAPEAAPAGKDGWGELLRRSGLFPADTDGRWASAPGS